MEINVKEFHKAEFEFKINEIINQLRDKDCQRVEFLRGMLAAYKELLEDKQGWIKKNTPDYFK